MKIPQLHDPARRGTLLHRLAAVMALSLAFTTPPVHAQSSANYAILYDLIDNGGAPGVSVSTSHRAHSLIGQPAVLTYAKGASHVVSSGAGCAFCESQITVGVEPATLPMTMRLYQNYPNPFNPSTTIRYSLEREASVTLSVFNLLGEIVAVIVKERQTPGDYRVDYLADALPGGVYMYRLSTEHGQLTRRFVLLK
jgi:hypothetical protein